MTFHYEGEDLIVRKREVGEMENNSYVLECPETHSALLVDACWEPEKLIDLAEGTDLVAIVQTHGHWDHVQALVDLVKHFEVPVWAHHADDYPVPVDRRLSDGDVLEFGNREAKVIHTPGHTPGGICLLAGRHLISGDTLFPGGPGNTRGDKTLFAEIMEGVENKLFTLPDDTVVYPGHGLDTTVGRERPHLGEWKSRGW